MTLAAVQRRNRSAPALPDPLEARLAALEARVLALEPPADVQWLTVIAASVAGHVFSVAELRAHVRVDTDLRRLLGGLTSRQVGNKLRTLAGRTLQGLVLERVGRDEAGCIWTVLHAGAGIDAERGA